MNSGCIETGVDSQQNSVNSIISLTPTVIVPLIGNSNISYKVRTLLDSGSESNWIARDVLKFIKHTKLNTIRLKVRHFNGVTPKKFDLVQVYINRTDILYGYRQTTFSIINTSHTIYILVLYDLTICHKDVWLNLAQK